VTTTHADRPAAETMKGRSLFKSPLPRSYLSDTSSSSASSSAAVATHRVYQVWRGKNVIKD